MFLLPNYLYVARRAITSIPITIMAVDIITPAAISFKVSMLPSCYCYIVLHCIKYSNIIASVKKII